jgi:hypothetical protein
MFNLISWLIIVELLLKDHFLALFQQVKELKSKAFLCAISQQLLFVSDHLLVYLSLLPIKRNPKLLLTT